MFPDLCLILLHFQSMEQDRISELPDEILHQILSLMATKFAVQTSILSTRWRHLWKFISTIHFDSFPYHPFRSIDYSFVDRTLEHHKAPQLHKFLVSTTIRGNLYTNLVPKWVDFALARQVQVLKLDFKTSPLPDEVFDLPPSFYAQHYSQYLKQISLGCAHLNPTLSFEGFSSLKELRLWCCKLSDEVVQKIVLKCKLLESFAIDKCRILKYVRILGRSDMRLKHFTFVWRAQESPLMVEVDAPSLVSLKFCGNLRRLCLGELPCLAEAKLFHDSSSAIDVGFVKEILDHKLAHLQLLGVDYWFVRYLAKEQSTNGKHWTASKSLKNFCWFGPLNKEYDIANLLAFLGDCPSLERINIYSRDYDRDGITKCEYTYGFKNVFMKLENGMLMEPCAGILHQVREVHFYYFSGFESEKEMIKRLLQKAVVLDSLFLTFEEPKDGLVFHKDLHQEEISSFPRASSHARILFS